MTAKGDSRLAWNTLTLSISDLATWSSSWCLAKKSLGVFVFRVTRDMSCRSGPRREGPETQAPETLSSPAAPLRPPSTWSPGFLFLTLFPEFKR